MAFRYMNTALRSLDRSGIGGQPVKALTEGQCSAEDPLGKTDPSVLAISLSGGEGA